MRRAVTLAPVALLLGCAGEVNFIPDGGDAALDTVREGLSFPDQGGLDTDRGVNPDAPAPALDGPRDGATLDVGGAPDAPALDLSNKDAAPTCSTFAQFTCKPIPPVIDCSSLCQTGGTQLGIACYVTGDCACVKNLTTVGTCPKNGSGCGACNNAFACCAAQF